MNVPWALLLSGFFFVCAFLVGIGQHWESFAPAVFLLLAGGCGIAHAVWLTQTPEGRKFREEMQARARRNLDEAKQEFAAVQQALSGETSVENPSPEIDRKDVTVAAQAHATADIDVSDPRRFFYTLDGTDVRGPIGAAELNALCAARVIQSSTYVCAEGAEAWGVLSEITRSPACNQGEDHPGDNENRAEPL